MAEPIVRSFQIDTGSSEQKLDALGNGLDNVENSSKSLRAQLKELQAQLANTDPQTDKYRELSQAAGELKDKISDAAQAVGTQAGGAFERVSGSLGLVTSRLLSLDFSGAAEGAKLFAKNASDIKLKDVSEGAKGLTSTLGTLGKALLTNPIFLLGTVIVGIIANFETLKNSGGALGKFFTGISDSVGFLKDSLLALSDAIGLTNTKAAEETEKAAQRAKEALADIKQFSEQISSDVEKRSSDIIKASDGNLRQARSQFKEYSDQVKEANQNLIDQANLIVERGGKLDEYQQNRLDAAIKENAALDKELADINKTINEADQKAQDDAQKREEDRLRKLEAQGQRLLAIRSQIYEQSQKLREQIEGDQTKPDSAKSDISDFDAEIKAQRDAEEFRISLMEEGVEKEIALADLKFARLRDAAGADAELRKQIAQQNEDEIVEIVKAAEEKKRQVQLETVQKGLEWASKGIDALTNLSDIYFAGRLASVKKGSKEEEALAKKQFNFNKKLQLAGAIIDAGKAITMSLSQSPVAIGPVPNPAGIASLAFVSLASAANIAKIASTKFEGGGSAPDTPLPSIGGGGGGDNGAQPAQFNPLAAQFVNNRPDQYTPRAYVLAGDVASQQEVRENVADLARVG